MEQFTNSDQTPAMLASNMFFQILNQIQSSNLNFHLQLTPFSANISLKKSFMKDKSGRFLLPFFSPENESKVKPENEDNSAEIKTLADQNIQLMNELVVLHKNHNEVVNDLANAHKTIEALMSQLRETKPIETKVYVAEIGSLKEKLKVLEGKIEEREDNIKELENAKKIAREGSNRINKELSECKLRFSQDIASIKKQHKSEVKAWRKELGEANKQKVKLQRELEKKKDEKTDKTEPPVLVKQSQVYQFPKAEVTCSICSEQIIDYKPKYFLGEPFNPACEQCDDSVEGDNSGPDPDGCAHSPVCVTRQPLPPPSPSVTFLQNDRSKYHEHMMSEYGAPGRYGGHERCLNGNSKNYGCDSCVWLKWFGDLHGFPDINPWDYKQYLETSEWAALGLY